MTKPTIAAFDFDGTLTYRDTLASFLVFAKGYARALSLFALKSPQLLAYVLGLLSRQKTKEACLTAFFSGESITEVDSIGERFALQMLDSKLRPEAKKAIAYHKEKGHKLVIVSASLETYLKPWGKRWGFDEVLASRLEVLDGKVTGKLEGKNCRGEEKVNRLLEAFGPRDSYTLYAYGNSSGDHELLAFADYPFYRTLS